ncbi:MAG: hypothetical protein V4659_00525 [Pseudomonadota bacterium]
MTRWLPHFFTYATCLCDFDGESEGRAFAIEWLGFTVELTLARRTRTLG